jgi:hypothetical protein
MSAFQAEFEGSNPFTRSTW